MVSCFQDPITDDGKPSDDEGAETGPPEMEGEWCVEEVAHALYDMGPDEELEDRGNNNGPPKACPCASETVNAGLDVLDTGDGAVVTNGEPSELIQFRDDVFAEWLIKCNQVAGNTIPTPDDNDCADVLTVGETALFYTEECAAESPYNPGNIPTDSWSDYYTLNNVISYNAGTYEIDEAFFEDLLANPGWLLHDDTFLALNGYSQYKFYNVQSGDVAAALGIQTGFIPLEINDYDVTSVFNLFGAYMILRQETQFDFEFDTPVAPVTLHYEVVP